MVSRDSLPEGLLSDVKNYLNITWSDADTDAKVSGLIASGMVYLNSKYGAEEYVRYARDSALDVFENNYQALILGMQNERLVSTYGDSVEGPDTAQ